MSLFIIPFQVNMIDEVFTIIGPINFSWVLSFDGIKANR